MRLLPSSGALATEGNDTASLHCIRSSSLWKPVKMHRFQMNFIWNPWGISQIPKKRFMDRNTEPVWFTTSASAWTAYYLVKSLCYIVGTEKEVQLMRVAFTSPICIHLQQRCLDHGLHLHETHVLSTQNCSLGYNGNMLLSAVLEVLGQAVHKSTQECIFFFFFLYHATDLPCSSGQVT